MSQTTQRPTQRLMPRSQFRRPIYYQPQSSISLGVIIAVVVLLVLLVLAGDYIYVTSNYIPPQLAPVFQTLNMSQKIQFYYQMRVLMIKNVFGY